MIGIMIPRMVNHAPRLVIPCAPLGISIPVIPSKINAPENISEYQVQYFIGL